MPSVQEHIRDSLLSRERAFWVALTSADPVPAIEGLCQSDANFLFPQKPIVTLDGAEPSLHDIIQQLSHQFDYYSLGDARTIILDVMAGVITYQITAVRGKEMYNATGSSTWSQAPDGEWLLACHQETLL